VNSLKHDCNRGKTKSNFSTAEDRQTNFLAKQQEALQAADERVKVID
jgi:hypothetical protein